MKNLLIVLIFIGGNGAALWGAHLLGEAYSWIANGITAMVWAGMLAGLKKSPESSAREYLKNIPRRRG